MDNTFIQHPVSQQSADKSVTNKPRAKVSAKINDRQLSRYQDSGFISAIEILTPAEINYFRHNLEQTCALLGGNISRLDGAHEFFLWAWELSSHPGLLDCIEQLLGPNIILKSTRFFYKHPDSASFVGWHQDGFTEQENGPFVPTLWLGLTGSCAENGCLQVIPGSHRLGLVPHPKRPHHHNLTHDGTTAQTEITNITNIEMPAGFMSLHHPLTVHGSQPNVSTAARIGFSASYATPKLTKSISPVAWVRGNGGTSTGTSTAISPDTSIDASPRLKFINKPAACSLAEASHNYRVSLGHTIRRCK